MNIAKKTVLITGANRGVGNALVKEALNRAAKRVFAGTRTTIPNTDPRVTALTLDVTNALQIRRAVDEVADLDVVINNAAIAIYEDLTADGWRTGVAKALERRINAVVLEGAQIDIHERL